MSNLVECPICDADVALSNDTIQGELIECSDCGTELEVTSLEPFAVQEAPQVEEDWGE